MSDPRFEDPEKFARRFAAEVACAVVFALAQDDPELGKSVGYHQLRIEDRMMALVREYPNDAVRKILAVAASELGLLVMVPVPHKKAMPSRQGLWWRRILGYTRKHRKDGS